MVERIVTAGREVLVASGYDAFSTNRVAAAAGVSPGSLYQYFPDKAAILDVVIDRYWSEVAENVAASLSDRIGDLGPAMVRDTADALVSALEADPVVLRVVAEEPADRPQPGPPGRPGAPGPRVSPRCCSPPGPTPAAGPRPRSRPGSSCWRWRTWPCAGSSTSRPPSAGTSLLDEMVALVGGYLSA
ncbi:TetR/AcrR family transcriptional regulator [Nocardioides sp. W3-2-3]|nr:TetR/AcrR family transcriptional regulator [Nocardioides convexus]